METKSEKSVDNCFLILGSSLADIVALSHTSKHFDLESICRSLRIYSDYVGHARFLMSRNEHPRRSHNSYTINATAQSDDITFVLSISTFYEREELTGKDS